MNIKLKDNSIIRLYDTIYVNTKPEDNTSQKIQGKAISQKNDNICIRYHPYRLRRYYVIILPDEYNVHWALCYHLAR
jgi:hypothetical protein